MKKLPASFKLSLHSWLILTMTVAAGLALLYIGQTIDAEKWPLVKFLSHEIGRLLFLGGPIYVIEHHWIRGEVMKEISAYLQGVLEPIIRYIPEIGDIPIRIPSLKLAGLVNIHPNLPVEIICQELASAKDQEIRILKIFLADAHRFVPYLRKALLNGNKVRILLCSLESKEAIRLRALAVGTTAKKYRELMQNSRDELDRLKQELPKICEERLQICTHHAFIGPSLFGIGDRFYKGIYLNGQYATEQCVEEIINPGILYSELLHHFEKEWNLAFQCKLMSPPEAGIAA